MDLLAFFNISIELGHSSQGQLIHQIDFVGVLQPAGGEILHSNGERGRIEQDLSIFGGVTEQFLDDWLKFG